MKQDTYVSVNKLRVGDWVIEKDNSLFEIVNITSAKNAILIELKTAIGCANTTKYIAVQLRSQVRIVKEIRMVKVVREKPPKLKQVKK